MNYDPRRLRGVLWMAGVTVGAIARRLELSESYISQQLTGAKPMLAATASVLRELLGADAMAWAAGQTDVLRPAPRTTRAPSTTVDAS